MWVPVSPSKARPKLGGFVMIACRLPPGSRKDTMASIFGPILPLGKLSVTQQALGVGQGQTIQLLLIGFVEIDGDRRQTCRFSLRRGSSGQTDPRLQQKREPLRQRSGGGVDRYSRRSLSWLRLDLSTTNMQSELLLVRRRLRSLAVRTERSQVFSSFAASAART
jgi:hypothetical protein